MISPNNIQRGSREMRDHLEAIRELNYLSLNVLVIYPCILWAGRENF